MTVINKLELEATLAMAAPFLMSKSFAPILTHFCFGNNTVVAFNDLQAIEVKYKNDLNCALPGGLLIKLLGSLQNNALEIVQKIDETLFKSGKSKFKLPTLPSEDFIFEMPDTTGCERIRLPLDVISGLSNCLVSTSHDLAKPEINGIRLIIEKGVLEFFSTDSITLSRFKYSSTNVPKCSIDIIIPAVFCEQLIRLTKTKPTDVEETAFVEILVSAHSDNLFLVAEIDKNVTIFTRLIDVEEKMNFKDIISEYEDCLTDWSIIPKEFINIINRACILVSPEDKFPTQLEAKDKSIFIDTQSSSGRSDDILEFDIDIEPGRLKINPESLKRVLNTMSHVSFIFPKNCLAFTGCNGNFLHIVGAKGMED